MSGLYARLAVCLLIALVAFGSGWKVQGWRKDSQIATEAAKAQEAKDLAIANARAKEDAQAKAINLAEALDVERNKEAKIVERIVTNDVIKYVQRPVSQSCGVDADGVRLINTSASGRMPKDTDAAPVPDARATGVTAATVVASVTENYATCHATENQLRALQDWVKTLHKAEE